MSLLLILLHSLLDNLTSNKYIYYRLSVILSNWQFSSAIITNSVLLWIKRLHHISVSINVANIEGRSAWNTRSSTKFVNKFYWFYAINFSNKMSYLKVTFTTTLVGRIYSYKSNYLRVLGNPSKINPLADSGSFNFSFKMFITISSETSPPDDTIVLISAISF